MRELRRTNDLVYLSAAEALLRAAGFAPVILDAAVSAAEGSVIAFPRRLMVQAAEFDRAAELLTEWEASL